MIYIGLIVLVVLILRYVMGRFWDRYHEDS